MRNIAASVLLVVLFPIQAGAQNEGVKFPDRPVRLVVPFAAGSSTDIVARVVGQKLGDALGQSVVVDNRAGAGGNIGAEFVVKSKADGYTLLAANNGLAISPALYRKLAYDPLKDLAPVAQLSAMPHVLVVRPALPANTVAELLALARAKPGELSFASSGTGASDHMAGELFKSMSALNIFHVAYKGGPPALTDVVGGQVTMYFSGLPSALPFVKSGRLRAVAVTTRKRSNALPDIPTVDEAGVPGYEVVLWYATYAPAKTPGPIIARLNQEIAKILRLAEVRERFAGIGVEPAGGTADDLKALLASELAKWGRVIETAGIKIDQ